MQGAEETSRINPLVAAILAGSAPRPLKISAVRGVLPLLRGELVRILVVLLQDGDDEVRREASARLSSFLQAEILPLLEDPTASAEVLDHFGCEASSLPSFKAAVIQNPATSEATLRRMAPELAAEQIDQLLMNQTRLISTPDLLDLLGGNPKLTPIHRTRIAEIRIHFLGASAPRIAREGFEPPGGLPRMSEPADGAEPATSIGPEAPPDTDPETSATIANATQKILRMDTAAKIQLAFKGNREERAILIKDSSRSVQEAVLQNPKLNENEVEGFARMRSVTEDILRIIAANRDWVKNYVVIQALATNPKTPAGIAMNMVSRLTNRDLKILCADKNVSEVIRRHAQKIAESRNQRSGSH